MAKLEDIETIVIVMMENRSFDHVVGHLRMPPYGNRADVNGLVTPADNPLYANHHEGFAYLPFEMKDDKFVHDLPHGRGSVKTQLAKNGGNTFDMSGFVQAYVEFSKGARVPNPAPMGFLAPGCVPVSNFFARQFMVCDHWYAPLPTDTQPNRSVAFSGYSLIEDTKARFIPVPPGSFVFQWLNEHNVRWRVYHSGLSFFLLFERFDEVLGDNFRSLADLPKDLALDPLDKVPQVIFIEPEYGDSPVHWNSAPNDNHPPTPMGPGEHFLREIYTALTKNPEKWQKTLLIVTHDEHGGFYDHVSPRALATPLPPNATFTEAFESTGPRVPAFIVSPWVPAGVAFNGPMDHTSILQLLAEKFAGNPDYNDEVKRRRVDGGIQSVSRALEAGGLSKARTAIPTAPPDTISNIVLGPTSIAPETDSQKAFAFAAHALLRADRKRAITKFPELVHLPDE